MATIYTNNNEFIAQLYHPNFTTEECAEYDFEFTPELILEAEKNPDDIFKALIDFKYINICDKFLNIFVNKISNKYFENIAYTLFYGDYRSYAYRLLNILIKYNFTKWEVCGGRSVFSYYCGNETQDKDFHKKIIKILLPHVNINHIDLYGVVAIYTALSEACVFLNLNIIHLLIKNFANINLENNGYNAKTILLGYINRFDPTNTANSTKYKNIIRVYNYMSKYKQKYKYIFLCRNILPLN